MEDVLIVASPSGAFEYSSINTSTRKAQHWYAQKMIESAEAHLRQMKHANILLLGTAAASIAFDLASRHQNVSITCIDTEKPIVAQTLLSTYFPDLLTRVKFITMDANTFMARNQSRWDVILCDVFIEDQVPDFIFSCSFLRNCRRSTTVLIINTIDSIFNMTSIAKIQEQGFRVKQMYRYVTSIRQNRLLIATADSLP